MRLALLHALPFDGQMWDGELDLLPGQVLAPRLYGLGSTLEEWAHAVLDLADGDPLLVVGCSVGGSCALEVAQAAPDRVVGIVLVGAKVGVRPEPGVRDRAIALLATGGIEAGWGAFWRPLFGSNASVATLDAAHRLALSQDVDEVIAGVRAFHDRRNLTAFARSWPKPLVVISGDQDRTPPPATAALAADRPGRAFHLIEDCGHYVNLEQPAAFRSVVSGTIDRLLGQDR